MARMAGRVSVEFYVGLALKARGQKQQGDVREEAVRHPDVPEWPGRLRL